MSEALSLLRRTRKDDDRVDEALAAARRGDEELGDRGAEVLTATKHRDHLLHREKIVMVHSVKPDGEEELLLLPPPFKRHFA